MWTHKLSMDSTWYYNVTFIEIHMGILTIYSKIDMKKKDEQKWKGVAKKTMDKKADISFYERLLLINFDIIPSTLYVYRFLSTSYSIYFIYFVASFY